MRRVTGAILATALLATPALAAPADDAAVRALADAEAAAWNAHDAHAFAALLAPDATFVNARGDATSGREAVEQRLARGFATIFAGSRMRIDGVTARPLGPDAAAARVAWTISGVRLPDGGTPADQPIVQTLALERVEGAWRIVSLQDTASLGGAMAAAAPPSPAPPAADTPAPKPPRRCILARTNGECIIRGKASR